jgi:transmembrane sensor
MHNSLQIEEIAAKWLARKDSGNWSSADEAELTAWLEAATAHRVAYIRLEAAWRRARRLKAIAAVAALAEMPQQAVSPATRID